MNALAPGFAVLLSLRPTRQPRAEPRYEQAKADGDDYD
jgi:hypothetical protein